MGGVFGPEKSNKWMISFITSFFESLLLSQPIKVGGRKVIGNVNEYPTMHFFWKSQTHSVNHSICYFDLVFPEIPAKNFTVGMLLTRPISFYPYNLCILMEMSTLNTKTQNYINGHNSLLQQFTRVFSTAK